VRGQLAAAYVAPGRTIGEGVATSLPPATQPMVAHHRASRAPIIQRASDLTLWQRSTRRPRCTSWRILTVGYVTSRGRNPDELFVPADQTQRAPPGVGGGDEVRYLLRGRCLLGARHPAGSPWLAEYPMRPGAAEARAERSRQASRARWNTCERALSIRVTEPSGDAR
jgi:hypothetical protein